MDLSDPVQFGLVALGLPVLLVVWLALRRPVRRAGRRVPSWVWLLPARRHPEQEARPHNRPRDG